MADKDTETKEETPKEEAPEKKEAPVKAGKKYDGGAIPTK